MAEKKVIELEVKSDSLGSLKSQLKAAQNEVNELAAKFGATSQEAVNAAKRAAELKDAIADAKALTDSFNPDGKFNALSASIGGALNGFQAFEGALGLVGVESEDLQKTLLKVESAMALSQGVQGLLEAKDSFKQLGAVAADALKGIRTGIAATGIGLLVVALGAIVAYWDDIKEAVSGVSSEQEALNVKTEENLKMSEEKVAALDKQDNILKLQGKTEKQILQYKVAELDTAIKIAEVNIENQKVTKAAQIEAAKRNKDILVGILDFLTSPINVLLQTIDKIASVVGIDSKLVKGFDAIKSAAANIVFDPAETAKEGDLLIKAAEERFIELKNQKAGYELQIQAIDKQAADARRQANKEANAKRLADEKERNEKSKQLKATEDEEEKARLKALYDLEVKNNEDRLKLQEAQYDLSLSLLKSNREKEIQELINSYDAKYEIANGNAELEKQLSEKLNTEIASINKKYADEDARLKEEQKVKDKEAADKELQRVKELNDAKIQAVQNTLSTIANLAQLFAGKGEKQAKKAFEIQKAANIANATIDTYKAATGAYASLSGIPVVGPVLGAAAAAAAIAAGLVNVKNIASQKFEGGGSTSANAPAPSGGGGGGGATGGNVVAPNFNLVGNAQETNPLAGLGEGIIQAYVVSGDVTTAQSLDRNRVNNATFG